MTFASPWFLLGGLLVVPLWYLATRTRAPLPKTQTWLVAGLQTIALLCVVLALAGPWRASDRAMHRVAVWNLAPFPSNVPEVDYTNMPRDDIQAWRAATPRSDPFHVIAAGRRLEVGAPVNAATARGRGLPDLVASVRGAAALVPAGAAGDIGLWTDGSHDGPLLEDLAGELTARGLRLHVRTLPGGADRAFSTLLSLSHPARTAPGEAFRLVAEVRATQDVLGQFTVAGKERTIPLRKGVHRYPIDVVLTEPGINPVEVSLVAGSFSSPQLQERSVVLVDAPLQVLHLTPEASRRQALAASLTQHGIVLVQPDPAQALEAAQLAGVAGVVVEDLAADQWPAASQQAVADAVLQRGLGFLLAGTHSNLGPGGYAGSPLASVLPVRMPQREERRDPSIALVLVIDTSGSMGGGRIELAKEVARMAVQRLQPHDKVGIVEFYGSKRWAAPLQPATNTIEVTRALNRMQAGGGTIIYEALEESYFALLNAHTRFQHILVLTDGGVESGPFEQLARRMAAAGQTVSTVLIGPLANSPFLINLAQWGRGRFYACPDRFQLPELQFREPQSALLPAVQERTLPLARSAEAEAVAAFAGDALPATGGIVEASVRDAAEVMLRTSGGEPYLVGWDQGAGRVLVLAGQVLGPMSGELRSDPAYAAFLADLLRSAAAGRSGMQPRLVVTAYERGARVQLELPAGMALGAAPVVGWDGVAAVSLVPAGGSVLEAFLPWRGEKGALLVARAGDRELARGAACPPASRTWRVADASAQLRQLAAATGGSVTDCDGKGSLPAAERAAQAPQVQELARPLALAAMVSFLLALLLRRLPWSWQPRPGAAALALLVALCGTGSLRAQEPVPAADPAAIRAAIDAELRARGDLGELTKRWQDASPLHRMYLALARGDLVKAAALCDDPQLQKSQAGLRVRLLEVLGRPKDALPLLDAMAEAATPVERGERLVQRAMLKHTAGDAAGAASDLRQAVAAAALPAFQSRIGVLAGSLGLYDLALELHTVRGEGRDGFHTALRRGLWQTRAGRAPEAAQEFEAAFKLAEMQRDRLFALSQLVGAERSAGRLQAMADRWLERAAGKGPALHRAELRTLLEVLRELDRGKEGLAVLGGLDAETRQSLDEIALDLAIEAGQPDVAVGQLRERLQKRPGDAQLRASLAILLADLQRESEAESVLREGIHGAAVRELRVLNQAGSQLALQKVVDAVVAAIGSSSEPGSAVEAVLLEVAHLRRQGRDAVAVTKLLAAKEQPLRPVEKVRIGEQLESLGRSKDAIALYTDVYETTRAEDLGMRIAWMLSESKVDGDRKRAQELYRQLWITAGSAARRVQAEDHVLDLAAREGNLADLAIELEQKLGEPSTENRPAVRDALVKIYTRARDAVGAAAILRQWQKDEPARAVEAEEQLTRVYAATEEFKNHERALERLLQMNPEAEIDYRQQMAMSALERGRPDDARKYIAAMLGKPGTPDHVSLEFSAGIYTLAAQHEAAVKLYRRALALHPERVETFLLLGNALRAAGQRQEATGTFQELMLHDLPDDLFVVAVDGLLNMEASAEVLTAATRAVRVRLSERPQQVFLYRVLQDLLESAGNEKGRLAALQDTVVVAGEQRTNFVRELMNEAETRRDWPTYVNTGRTMLMLGDEVPPAVFLSLGEAMLQAGDVDAATRAFARARLSPDFATVESRIAELYEKNNRLADAERVRRRILRRTPDDTVQQLALARVCERQGDGSKALPIYLQVAVKLLPTGLASGRERVPARAMPIVLPGSRSQAGPTFAEPFAGLLRCAQGAKDLMPLQEKLLAECGAEVAAERALAALQILRHLALAFEDPALSKQVLLREDAVLAKGDARTRQTVLERRLHAGEVGAALPLADGKDVTWDQLRLLLLSGDDLKLAVAAERAPAALLPQLARVLLLTGRRPMAQALLQRLEGEAKNDPDVAGAEWLEVSKLLGQPADDSFMAQRRMDKALAAQGTPVQKASALLAALRSNPNLPEAHKRAHLLTLATLAQSSKDAALAERVLAAGGQLLPQNISETLVEMLFTNVDRVYLIGTRVQHLKLLPGERALELLRTSLRKFAADERRTQQYRVLQSTGLQEEVMLGVAADLDLDRLGPTDQYQLNTLASRFEHMPASVRSVLLEKFEQKLPQDPSTLLIRMHDKPAGAERMAVAMVALRDLASRRDLEPRVTTVIDALLQPLSTADAEGLLGSLTEKSPLQLRTALLRRVGKNREAADAMVQALSKRPDDTSLLYSAARLLENDGMLEQAAELYRTARRKAATFYAHQAQQLARLELRLGHHQAALDALLDANDPLLSNFRLLLRVLTGVEDPARRQALLKQALQRRGPSGRAGVVSFARMSGMVEREYKLAEVLRAPSLPSLSPKDAAAAEEAASDYDMLAFLPEGEEVARAVLRAMDGAARDGDLGVYRGMLGAAQRRGRAEVLLREAGQRLQAEPNDAEALRVMLAAAQIGLKTPTAVLRAAFLRRISEQRLDTAVTVEMLALAQQVGDGEMADQILGVLLSQRANLMDMRLRPWLPGLLALACARAPERVIELAPAVDGDLQVDVDSELLAAVALQHPKPVAAVAAFGPAVRQRMEGAGEVYRDTLVALPWCGLLLATGDLDGAVQALQRRPPTPITADSVQPHVLAAAVPPLSRWAHPEQSDQLAAVLVTGAGDGEEERRGLFVRLGAVLAARLEAAGKAEAATELRGKLRTAAAGLPLRLGDWLGQS